MVGQRFGVWSARLARRLILLTLAGFACVFFTGRFVRNWLSESPDSGVRESNEVSGGVSLSDAGSESVTSHPLDKVLALASEAMDRHKRDHVSYRATIRKRERIGKELGAESRMELKLRYREENPDTRLRRMDVYLKFLEPRSQAGREVIWQEDRNDGMMFVHESGFLNITRLELSPTSRLAMMGNRYPVSDIGIERLLFKLLGKGNRDRLLGDCEVTTIDSIDVEGRNCQRIEVCHPEAQVLVGDRKIDHEFYKAIIDIDLEYGVPIRYVSYMWPEKPGQEPILDEEFLYEQLEFNPPLEDEDFDPDNPAYNYP